MLCDRLFTHVVLVACLIGCGQRSQQAGPSTGELSEKQLTPVESKTPQVAEPTFEADYTLGIAALNTRVFSIAAQHISVLATTNDIDSQYLLSELYLHGDGLERNPATASSLAAMAAEQGQPMAQYQLGRMYLHGVGRSKDFVEAVKWFTLSGANKQWETSKANLANTYLRSVDRDEFFTGAPPLRLARGMNRFSAIVYRDDVARLLTTVQRDRVKDLVKEWWDKHPDLHVQMTCPFIKGCDAPASESGVEPTASAPSGTWNRSYGHTESVRGRALVAAGAGRYLVIGEMTGWHKPVMLMLIDSTGEIVSTRVLSHAAHSLDPGFIVALPSGEFALGGKRIGERSWDAWVTKHTASGVEIWTWEHGGERVDEAVAALPSEDGGLLLLGTESTRSGSVEDSDIVLVRLDVLGKLDWIQRYKKPGRQRAVDIVRAGDGYFTLSKEHNTAEAIVLTSLDSRGRENWTRTFPGTPAALRMTADGGGIIAATANSDFCLIRTDSSGKEVWRTAIGTPDVDSVSAVAVAPDADFVIVGTTRKPGTVRWDARIVRTDRAGRVRWKRTYTGDYRDGGRVIDDATPVAVRYNGVQYDVRPYGVHAEPDGSLVVVGTTDSSALRERAEIWVLRTDPNGLAPERKTVLALR